MRRNTYLIRPYEVTDDAALAVIFEENGFVRHGNTIPDGVQIYVYERAGEIVGAICFARNTASNYCGLLKKAGYDASEACVVNAVAVKESMRGRGIGTALLAYAFARRCSCTKIVLSARPGTEQHYARIGFVSTGEMVSDHTVMVLER
jgi:GNAT superfamily N-acetyltransferase